MLCIKKSYKHHAILIKSLKQNPWQNLGITAPTQVKQYNPAESTVTIIAMLLLTPLIEEQTVKYTKQRVQPSSRRHHNESLHHRNKQPTHQETRGISMQIIIKPITGLFKRIAHSFLKKQALKRPNNRFRKTAPVNYKLIALALAIVISGIFLIGDDDEMPLTTEQEIVSNDPSELGESHTSQSLEMPQESLTTEIDLTNPQAIALPDPIILAEDTDVILTPSPTKPSASITSPAPTHQLKAETPAPVTTAPEQKHISANAIRQENWILQQNPKEYTLQLLATVNETSLTDFIKKNNIQANAAYYRTNKNSKTWYSLVYGTYDTYSLAQQAVQTLPPTLKKLNPWVRNFGQIQKRLK